MPDAWHSWQASAVKRRAQRCACEDDWIIRITGPKAQPTLENRPHVVIHSPVMPGHKSPTAPGGAAAKRSLLELTNRWTMRHMTSSPRALAAR